MFKHTSRHSFTENLPLDLHNLPKEETIPEEEPAKEEKVGVPLSP